MAYSDFSITDVMDRFGVDVTEDDGLFADVPDGEASPYLTTVFSLKDPFSLNTEQSRRELLISPVLADVFSRQSDRIAIFAGENFEVDKSQSLTGTADYLICISKFKTAINAPVIAVADAKNSPSEGIGQCIAELVAVTLFNERRHSELPTLFGIITNGEYWIFGKYDVDTKLFTYNPTRFSLDRLPRVIGILAYMLDEALSMFNLRNQ